MFVIESLLMYLLSKDLLWLCAECWVSKMQNCCHFLFILSSWWGGLWKLLQQLVTSHNSLVFILSIFYEIWSEYLMYIIFHEVFQLVWGHCTCAWVIVLPFSKLPSCHFPLFTWKVSLITNKLGKILKVIVSWPSLTTSWIAVPTLELWPLCVNDGGGEHPQMSTFLLF